MGEENPLALLVLLGVTVYAAAIWLRDYRAGKRGVAHANALPGAVPARAAAIIVGIFGAVVLVLIETKGEYALGISTEQSTITWLFAVYTIAAAFLEELIFRGYIVVLHRGTGATIAGVVAASVMFAALHPFVWEWRDGALHWIGGTKGWFSTAMVFASSLWFYALRFMPLNPNRSLVPCITAHAAKNLTVVAVKAAQGFVVGIW
jgi:uncharacterized protein